MPKQTERVLRWARFAACALIILTASDALPQQPEPKIQWPTEEQWLFKGETGKPLARAGLSPSELKSVRAALKRVVNSASCRDGNIQGCGALESRVDGKVRIASDGEKAVYLESQSDCGTAGCPIYLVQTAHSGKVLLETFGWGFAVLPSQEHGYYDVVTAEGNHDTLLIMWRMKDDHYQPSRCASVVRDESLSASETTNSEIIVEHPCPGSS